MGGLDILVNNAGFESVADSLEVTPALWDAIVDTNLKGAFFVAQAAARLMAAGEGGAGPCGGQAGGLHAVRRRGHA